MTVDPLRMFLGISACLLMQSLHAGVHQVEVDFRRLDRVEVQICPGFSAADGAVELRAGARGAGRWIERLELLRSDGSARRSLPVPDSGQPIRVPHGHCASWRSNLERTEALGRWQRARYPAPDQVLASPALWLWLPALTGPDEAHLRLLLAPGHSASVPWHRMEDGRYRITPTAGGWSPVVAVGRLEQQVRQIGGARLTFSVLAGSPAPDATRLIDWMADTAAHATLLYGRFPVPEAQVIAQPIHGERADRPRAREPVPFARVLREGGNAVQFFVDQTWSDADYRDDWTATHEFAHLLLPFVTLDGAWITEGFASYYQNVLRARAGWLTEAEAWQALRAGFERGGRRSYGRSLEQSMRVGGRNRTQRMYWSGAAIALLADLELRRRSEGSVSLDTVLDELSRCCLPAERDWSDDELVAKLDEMAGMPVLASLRDRWLHSTAFPAWQQAFERLGIRLGQDRVHLVDGPDARYRQAIMKGRGAAVRNGSRQRSASSSRVR